MVKNSIEGSLEVKVPTIWTDENQRWEELEKKVRRESQKREDKKRKRRSKQRDSDQRSESQKKEDAGERKVGKSRNTVFFQ